MMKWRSLLATVGLLLATALPAQAQIGFGGQVSFADDADLGVGVRATAPLGGFVSTDEGSVLAGTMLIGSFDWFFPDCGGADCSYWEINTNGAVPIPVEANFSPYAGAGLNIAHMSVDEGTIEESDTEVGLNLLGGVTFPLAGFSPFLEARLELGGGEQFVLSGGVLLGGD